MFLETIGTDGTTNYKANTYRLYSSIVLHSFKEQCWLNYLNQWLPTVAKNNCNQACFYYSENTA